MLRPCSGSGPVSFAHSDSITSVSLPPARIHCVINIRNCVKLAWELYDCQHLGLYFDSYLMHGVLYFEEENAEDYMWACDVLLNCVEALAVRMMQCRMTAS